VDGAIYFLSNLDIFFYLESSKVCNLQRSESGTIVLLQFSVSEVGHVLIGTSMKIIVQFHNKRENISFLYNVLFL
jgi:hypothetical protein